MRRLTAAAHVRAGPPDTKFTKKPAAVETAPGDDMLSDKQGIAMTIETELKWYRKRAKRLADDAAEIRAGIGSSQGRTLVQCLAEIDRCNKTIAELEAKLAKGT